MEIQFVKTLSGTFKLAFDSDFEKAKKLPLNEPFSVTYVKKRNIKFHRKFFALINMVYQNQERYNNYDELREHLTIASGYFNLSYDLDGVETKKAKSISFSKMDETEFSDLYNAVIDTIIKYFHFEKQDIIDNIEQFF
jgi:hypothetical protein